MKSIYYYLFFIVCLLSSCKGETVDVSKLVAERDSLKAASDKNLQDFNTLNYYVEELAISLDSIYMSEGFITTGKNEEGKDLSRKEIKQSLQELGKLVARQRQHIATLEDSLKASTTSKNGNLLSIIENLKFQLETKERTIAQLQSELATTKADITRLSAKVSSLNNEVTSLNEKNKGLTDALVTTSEIINTGYVIMGTKKELKKLGVLDGGILKKKKLSSTGLNPENARKVDITTVTEITINSKNPKIYTAMPSSAYRLTKKGNGKTTLTITDPTSFWRASNFLVISTD